MRVSVVVPTYRRPELLCRCLRALQQQDFDPKEFEVIVADNAGDAETQTLVAEQAKAGAPPLRYVAAAGGRGPAFARNSGWRAGQDFIAFTDDDTMPEPGWLRAGVEALATADAAWGAIRVPLREQPTDYERNEAGLETAEFATANVFCRRAALEAVGGFDERFTAAWREDADLFFTLLEQGFRVVHVPEAVVVHPVRPGRWGISLSQQRKSEFNALLYKKHPALYRQRIQPAPPWHYYLAAGAMGLTVAGTASGVPGAALAGFGLWLALTARFSAGRLRGTSHAPAHVAEMAVTSALIPLLSVFWRLHGALRYRVFFL